MDTRKTQMINGLIAYSDIVGGGQKKVNNERKELQVKLMSHFGF